MDVITRSQAPGKSLPAEMVVGGKYGLRRLMQNNEVLQQRGLRGLGYTAEEWASMLQGTTAATLPLLIAQNPGTLYTQNKDGSITVYAQPTGSTQNLPVGVLAGGGGTGAASGASGSVSTKLGSASFGGIDTTTIGLVVVAGLLVYMMMRGQR
jgi:hypothetical protein